MKKLSLFFLLFYLTAPSCATYKQPGSSFCEPKDSKEHAQKQDEASNHWLYAIIPRHREQVRWYDLGHWCMWAFFGNDDDGIFGEAKSANYGKNAPIGLIRAVKWTIRNPFHNFCFYVIGDAYRQNDEYVVAKISPEETETFRHYEKAKTVFCSKDTSFFFGFHGFKPFLSLRIRLNDHKTSDFYVGWRERGNFGIKFAPYTSSNKTKGFPEKQNPVQSKE